MTKDSARKHWDKITDFDTTEDAIYLDQAKFPDLALGDLADTDTHITYKHDSLFYDDVRFVKFTSAPPASLDDIHIVIYA